MRTRIIRNAGLAGLAWAALCGAQSGEVVWAPKPAALPRYTPPHRPVTRLAELLAAHRGQAAWRQVAVDDGHLRAEYIQSAPGETTPRRFHPDTREWWIVLNGQIRFQIEGQEPFTAPRGALVQAPEKTIYSMETVGTAPALRLEVNIAHAKTLYPRDVQPPALPNFDWIPVRLSRQPGVYDRGNVAHVTLAELAERPEYRGRNFLYSFVTDDRAAANVIYGWENKLPPIRPGDRGHYHPESAEFWLILAGQIRYAIEGQDVIIASEGDLVYVPAFTFHLPRFYGPGPSCRLAMNGYPRIAHLYGTGRGE